MQEENGNDTRVGPDQTNVLTKTTIEIKERETLQGVVISEPPSTVQQQLMPEGDKLGMVSEKHETIVNNTFHNVILNQKQELLEIVGRNKNQPSLGVVLCSEKKIDIQNVGVPMLLESSDAIVRITTSAICGMDMHQFKGEASKPDQKRTILGHEAVGVVDEVGSNVSKFKKGDRVVVAGILMCGSCGFCLEGKTALCLRTNVAEGKESTNRGGQLEFLREGHGLQAELARVPLADFNLLMLPDTVSDEAAVTLSEALCAAWHGLMLAEVDKDTESLAIWGAGPVGVLTVHLAKYLGVKRVYSIDHHNYRLERARHAGAQSLNFREVDVVKTLYSLFRTGVQKCIDCVGYHYPKPLKNRLSLAMKMEPTSRSVLEEMINVCKRGGVISLIGDYVGAPSTVEVGTLMNKGITLRSGRAWVQAYWEKLLRLIDQRAIDPTIVVSHQLEFSTATDGYKTYHYREDQAFKILLKTKFYEESGAGKRAKFAFEPASRITPIKPS